MFAIKPRIKLEKEKKDCIIGLVVSYFRRAAGGSRPFESLNPLIIIEKLLVENENVVL